MPKLLLKLLKFYANIMRKVYRELRLIERNSKNIVQFIKFGIVGVSNTAVSFGCYYFLLWVGCHYLVANVIAWVISVFNAYYWNNKYVFANDTHWFKALMKTYMSYGFSAVLGTGLLYLLVEFCSVSELIAPVFVLLLTIPLNFVLNKFWTFR